MPKHFVVHGRPTQKYETLEQAKAEADRLAKDYGFKNVWVSEINPVPTAEKFKSRVVYTANPDNPTDNPTKIHTTENYRRVRVRSPSYFQRGSFRTINLPDSDVKAVIGRPEGKTETEIQALLFPKERYTERSVKTWLKRHKIKRKQKRKS